MSGIDDKVIDDFYKLQKNIRGISEKASTKTLHDMLHEEATTYYNENRDKKNGHLKFKSDEEARKFASTLWDKAAEHIAEKYLNLDKSEIKKRKAEKDEDGNSLWEQMMAAYIGKTKKGFQDEIANIGEISPDNLYDALIKPIYSGHIQIRANRLLDQKIRSTKDAQNAIEYLKIVKKHNPDTFKRYKIPSKIASPQEASDHFLKFVSLVPKQYNPSNAATHEKTYK